MNKKKQIKIVLICDSVQREKQALLKLKRVIENQFEAEVFLVGSLAEEQRIYYFLNKIQPEVVFISQIQETVTRNIAKYVKKSGGLLCVLPVELSYSNTNLFWLFNKRLSYNRYVDLYFTPGKRMHQDLVNNTNISLEKLFIVGSPKIDLLNTNFMSRKEFCKKYKIPNFKKNIFIYTTFYAGCGDYIKSEKAFKGNVKKTMRIYRSIEETKKVFLKSIENLAKDFPNFNIIVKPHPLEDMSAYLFINNINLFIITNDFFNNTIKSIDLAIHWNSTIATECWLSGKKTLQYFPFLKYKDLMNDFSKGNPVLTNYEVLTNKIKYYLYNPLEKKYLDYQQFYISSWYYKVDGKSSERISKILKNKFSQPISVKYERNFGIWFYLFLFFEKLIGVSKSRKIISFFIKEYHWEFPVKNYIKYEQN